MTPSEMAYEEEIQKELNPLIAKPGSVHVYSTQTGRFEQDFMSGWREFNLGKFAVSSIKLREEAGP